MPDVLSQILLFSAKFGVAIIFTLVLFAGILALLSRGKQKLTGKICIKHLNKKWDETKEELLQEILPKKKFKAFLKQQKQAAKKPTSQSQKSIFVLNFDGDVKGSAVTALREEVSAVLNIATPEDEVVVRLESPGGMVNAYGLAAAQLFRLREKNIPLTVTVDKVAASGGYMMACIANKILAAPFAILGSIGVIMQLPNFHRWLKEKNIDFEQITAGQYKRTLTLFGHNTEEGREKMREEIEDIHTLFKNLIQEYRPQLNIEQVSTGEYWLGKQALALKLVDGLTTSDDYLFEQSQTAAIYEICYTMKKSLAAKLSSAARSFKNDAFGLF